MQIASDPVPEDDERRCTMPRLCLALAVLITLCAVSPADAAGSSGFPNGGRPATTRGR